MEDKKKDKKNNNKKKILIVLGIILLIIILLLIWWFNRKFDVVFKYNNGEKDYTVKVKYLNKINEKDILKDLKLSGYSFIGYYETYLLDGKKSCKDGFKLDNANSKCVSKTEFDFGTKIKKNTTIEALWSGIVFVINPTSKTINEKESFNIVASVRKTTDKTVTWNSLDKSIATVDSNGKVIGVKEGKTTIEAISNGIRRTCIVTVKKVEEKKEEKKEEIPTVKKEEKDEGKISLSISNSCMIGSSSLKVTAKLTNAKDKTISWSIPDCYKTTNVSDTVKTITRNSCGSSINTSPVITAKLKNGSTAKVSFTYEDKLTFSIYQGNNLLSPNADGNYYGNGLVVKTNIPATFTGKETKVISTTSATTKTSVSDNLYTIKTKCGQTATVKVMAVIN